MRFLGAVASVGMLATEAERFLSGGRGAKEVAEGRNQSSNGSTCAPLSRDERERSKARDEGHRAPSVHERSVGYGGFDDSSLNPCKARMPFAWTGFLKS